MTQNDLSHLTDMPSLRAAIDALDWRLAELLAERTRLIDRAAQIKAGAGLPARIDHRVEEVAANARANAEKAGYDPELADALWRLMMEHFIAQEARALGEADDR
ncbi:chorismate mutase [Paracoccus sp. Z118]|uniref:chorismate mutase n=1 Tax=Paracoccus sp. Z118 TaxID=2851017 RepID=UPI001C2B8D9D|nr:chorismate mutase [Paracoccus sp. Z118]MBV0891322.1 chorismate mutase [Paracoccus sp. Z118]